MSQPPSPQPLEPGKGITRSFPMFRVVMALVLREMSTKYGRSPGGYLWGILEPLGAIFILTVALTLLLRSPPLGTSFILFYASGYVPFSFYANVSTPVMRSLMFSKALLAYPAVTWGDALIARLLLNSLTGILVSYIVIGIILLVQTDPVALSMGPILEAMLLAFMVGLGVGTLNCAIMGLVDAWAQIWGVFNRPLFLASGVFFLYDGMPPLAQEILWYNPLIHITAIMREGFYPTYDPSYVSVTYVVAFSLITLFLGVVLLGRYHREILTR